MKSEYIASETDGIISCVNPNFDAVVQEILSRGACVRFRARGTSMHPFLRSGDVLLIKPENATEFSIGDIVFFRHSCGNHIAHRLIKKESKSVTLITKGDNLPYYDEPVSAKQVLGRVIAVEREGHCLCLDSILNKAMKKVWARLSPMSRWLYPILRPGWKLYRRFSQRDYRS